MNFVSRMTLESRIKNLCDFGATLQESRDLLGRIVLSFNSQRQRLQATQQQPRLKRTQSRAFRVLLKRELFVKGGIVGDQSAGCHVAVAAQKLRR